MGWAIAFWIGVACVFWLGLRHLISGIVGINQQGPVKSGQRLCHLASLVLLWGGALIAIVTGSWWPLAIGWTAEFLFRQLVRLEGAPEWAGVVT